MITDTRSLEVTRRIAAPPERVFDAWLDPAGVGEWLFATPDGVMERVEIDPRVGGGFRIDERRGEELASHRGTYIEIDRPRRLVFDFHFDETQSTRVTVAIAPEGDGSRLTLTHEGVWADYEDRTRDGWTKILEGLEQTVARG